jgi:hypothetical protein
LGGLVVVSHQGSDVWWDVFGEIRKRRRVEKQYHRVVVDACGRFLPGRLEVLTLVL